MVSTIHSMGLNGIEAFIVTIEADVSSGMPMCDIVGLPDTAIKEARNRVRAALKNCGYSFPVARITVNLAPANIKKTGSLYDLPILLSILSASGQINMNLSHSVFIGELSLSGQVCPVKGVLPMVTKAKEEGFKNIFVPWQNAAEAAVVDNINVFPLKSVPEFINHLQRKVTLKPQPLTSINKEFSNNLLDFCQVKGQHNIKRALEIAAAGGHNILLIGPPGAGKSMLAQRIPSILPDMTIEEIIETTKVYSIAGILPADSPLVTQRPFRDPHHTISAPGLSGGGSIPHPGELSLAHNGVLFLDEFPEFSRPAMEALRQPLEDGMVTISRAMSTLTYPCEVMLVAAMNPCPCGYYGHSTRKCVCSAKTVANYLTRISGPMLDRMDIHIEVAPINFENLSAEEDKNKTSANIKNRVNDARQIQIQRYKSYGINSNARVPSHILHQSCPTTDSAKIMLKKAFETMSMSARGYDKVLKIARTVADLAGKEIIDCAHVAEAVQYRSLDKKYWHK